MEPETNTQPIPPTAQQPPIQPPTLEKHKPSILLWLLILALIGVTSYFGYQNWQLRQQIFQNQSAPTPTNEPQVNVSTRPTITPTPSTTQTQIPGWKYYSNADFTFQYPGNWTIGQGGQALVADTAGAGATIFSKNTPMYNECMKLDKTDTINGKMVKYYSYAYSTEACSNQANIGNFEAWITKAGGDGFQPGIIYMYNTTFFPKSFSIFQQILSTFTFTK